MEDKQLIFHFILATLVTWRITHLIAKEDGPGQIIFFIRKRLGRGFWGQLMDCFNCLSIWVGAPLAFFIGESAALKIMVWLALSGAAIIIEKYLPEPLTLEEEEKKNELL
ncbi:hypothetical protein HX99_03935 [Peptococcaceae bacterium SCADC1_2_3]|jgi:hypothetical protein|nr:hypothetical protein HX99_03935 [Peptococcaceae bacterium SCADC1_2_3]HBQ29364.1 DUF1360 domain-containing protein [Desulfotomaculum sp.]HCJ78626.1 DUF1360 domain-containing protein [Desulfotomaculum sp.]